MDILIHPFSNWTADRILEHFSERKNVHYFPVIADPDELTRDKMQGVLTNRFEFNGECHVLADGFDWTKNPHQDVEWFILLHKFYYAVGLGAAYQETGDSRYLSKWVQLTDSWIESTPIELLSSDVTGRRIQNWIFAHHYFVADGRGTALPPEFHSRFLASLHSQVVWLRGHLTRARNHRTLELCAIFVAAIVFPEMRDAADWLDFARAELIENMRSDILPDGVQCELSTDYHHIVLRNLLVARRLAHLNEIALPEEADSCIRRALEFSKWAHRPDGLIPSLSDGDTGSFLDLLQQGYDLYGDRELLYVATKGAKGRAPNQLARGFEASGYYVVRSGWGEREHYAAERYLIFDCGPIGAGNHGHFDLLHFEAYAFGRPLVIDPGRYTYHEGTEQNWRVLFRSTAYHNTVTVGGRNQTRYEFDRTRFKIRGPEPERELRQFSSKEDLVLLNGVCRSHEYAVIHERRILFVRGEYWLISDVLSGIEYHDYDVWFHLSPEAHERVINDRHCATAPFVVLAHSCDIPTSLTVEPGFISPRYGVKHGAPIVRIRAHGRSVVFHTAVVPYSTTPPEVAVESCPERAVQVTVQSGERATQDRLDFDHLGSPTLTRQQMNPGRQFREEFIEAR